MQLCKGTTVLACDPIGKELFVPCNLGQFLYLLSCRYGSQYFEGLALFSGGSTTGYLGSDQLIGDTIRTDVAGSFSGSPSTESAASVIWMQR